MRKQVEESWRPAWPPGAAVGVGSRPGASVRYDTSSVARGGPRVRVAGGGDHGGARRTGGFWLRGRRASRASLRMLGTKTIVGCRPEIGELLMETELLYAKVDSAGGRRPVGPAEVDAMSGAQSISTRRASARAAGLPRVAPRPLQVYARRQATRSPALCSIGAAPDDVHIRRVLRSLAVSWRATEKPGHRSCGSLRTSKERVAG